MKRNNPNIAKKKPTNLTRRRPAAPVVVWSNSAYVAAADERSSVASNEVPPEGWPLRRRRGSSSIDHHHLMCDEEISLREELGREIEKELERELMDGILVLVRRLSDLKAKQFLRELGDPLRILMNDDGLMRKNNCQKNGVRKKNLGKGYLGDDGYCSDAESRTKEVKHAYGRGWSGGERF